MIISSLKSFGKQILAVEIYNTDYNVNGITTIFPYLSE